MNLLKKNKKLITCSRLEKYGEHINDHQIELVDKFYEEGYILKIDETNNLDEVLIKLNYFTPKKYYSNIDEFTKNWNMR